MGSTKINSEKRDYSQEYRDNYETQLKYAQRIFDSEEEFQPKYAGLQAGIMEEMAPRLMELYEGKINPALSRMDLEATRNQRVSIYHHTRL